MVETPANSKDKADKAARERSATADYAVRPLMWKVLKHRHSLLENNTLYALETARLSHCIAVEQFVFHDLIIAACIRDLRG